MQKQTEIDFFKQTNPPQESTINPKYNKFYIGAISGLVGGGFAAAVVASAGYDSFTTDSLRFIGSVASSVAFIRYVKKPKHTTTALLVLGGAALSAVSPIALVSHIATTIGSMGMTGVIKNIFERKKSQ